MVPLLPQTKESWNLSTYKSEVVWRSGPVCIPRVSCVRVPMSLYHQNACQVTMHSRPHLNNSPLFLVYSWPSWAPLAITVSRSEGFLSHDDLSCWVDSSSFPDVPLNRQYHICGSYCTSGIWKIPGLSHHFSGVPRQPRESCLKQHNEKLPEPRSHLF